MADEQLLKSYTLKATLANNDDIPVEDAAGGGWRVPASAFAYKQSNGNYSVGFTVTAPARLSVASTGGAAAPLGTVNGNASLYLTNSDSNYGLVVNVVGSGNTQFQSQRSDGNPAAYNITFQTLGGNVGIGTTNPVKKFAVSASGANGLEIAPDEGNYTRILSYNRLTAAYTPLIIEGSYVSFLAQGGEVARIDASSGLLFTNAAALRAGAANQLIAVAGSGGFFQQVGGNYYTVTTSGGATSDIAVKTDIEPIGSSLDKLLQLRGVYYTRTDEPLDTTEQGRCIGVIAQEIEAQFPELVTEGEQGKQVKYERLVAVLIEAVKELSAKVDKLEKGTEV